MSVAPVAIVTNSDWDMRQETNKLGKTTIRADTLNHDYCTMMNCTVDDVLLKQMMNQDYTGLGNNIL